MGLLDRLFSFQQLRLFLIGKLLRQIVQQSQVKGFPTTPIIPNREDRGQLMKGFFPKRFQQLRLFLIGK